MLDHEPAVLDEGEDGNEDAGEEAEEEDMLSHALIYELARVG
jgi:hypothetical protein